MHACTDTHTNQRTHAHTNANPNPNAHTRTPKRTQSRTHVHTHIHTRTPKCTRTQAVDGPGERCLQAVQVRTHTQSHTHTHTHTNTHAHQSAHAPKLLMVRVSAVFKPSKCVPPSMVRMLLAKPTRVSLKASEHH